jgi:hypothetical protein
MEIDDNNNQERIAQFERMVDAWLDEAIEREYLEDRMDLADAEEVWMSRYD